MAESDRARDSAEDAFELVANKERNRIATRRVIAFESAGDDEPSDEVIRETLCGLALSGGGIRSAMFNLGFVQALENRDLLRHVDYLSSVSGGGYIAGYLAALATREANRREPSASDNRHTAKGGSESDGEEASATDDDAPTGRPKLDLGIDNRQSWNQADAESNDTAKTSAARRYTLYDAGRYISDYLSAGWHLFRGLLIPVSWLLAVWMFAVASAIIWRLFDFQFFRMYWNALGFDSILGEFWISFVPFFVLVAITTACAIGEYFRNRRAGPQASESVLAVSGRKKLLLIFGGVTLLISFAVGLGNGYTQVWSLQPAFERTDYVFAAAIVVILLQLPVLFGGRSLVQSAQHEAPAWKQAFSYTVCYVAFLGIWFFSFYMFGRENISGFATYRAPDLLVTDIKDPEAFLSLLKEKAFKSWNLGELKTAIKENVKERDEVARLRSANVALDKARTEYYGEDSWEKHQGRFFTWGNAYRLGTFARSGFDDWGKVPHAFTAAERIAVDRQTFIRSSIPPIETAAPYAKIENSLTKMLLCKIEQDRALEGLLQGKTPSARKIFELKDKKLTIGLIEQLSEQAFRASEDLDGTLRKEREEKKAGSLVSATDVIWADLALINKHVFSNPPSSVDAFAVMDDYVRERATPLAEGKKLVESWDKLTLHGADSLASRGRGKSLAAATDDFESYIEDWTEGETASFNRLLLEALYPAIIRERTQNSTLIVAGWDQVYRLSTLAVLVLIVPILFFYIIDLNRASPWMKVYREGIYREFLQQPFQGGVDASGAVESPIKLADLKTCDAGMPYPLFVAAALIRGNEGRGSHIRSFPFVLTQDSIGGPDFGYAPTTHNRPTQAYRNSEVTLLDAMALSGAAFAPLMAQDIIIQMLMSFTNLRLGNWLPNPKQYLNRNREQHQFRSPADSKSGLPIVRPTSLIAETLRRCVSVKPGHDCWNDWELGFVADGGFRDFLGVEELLRRKCRLIITVDAGCNNGKYELGALADLIRIGRRLYGIQLLDLDHETPIDIERIRRDRTDRIPQPYIACRIRYPKGKDGNQPEDGFLFYCQMSLTGNEEIDLQQFRHIHPNFPDEPITNQFYTQDQVESYRQLGYHIGQLLCSEMPSKGTTFSTKTGVSERFKERFEAITRRLLAGYSEEALRETSVEGDIEPIARAVRHHDCWDLGSDKELVEPCREIGLDKDDKRSTVREALRTYDTNASFRRAYRRFVSHLYCGSDAIHTWTKKNRDETPCASVVALVYMTCSDLIYGVRHPLARGNFQVGGRERLVWLCEDYAGDDAGNDENSLPDSIWKTRDQTVLSKYVVGSRCFFVADSEDDKGEQIAIPTDWYDDESHYCFQRMRDGWNLATLAAEMSKTVLVSESVPVAAAFLESCSMLLPNGKNLTPSARVELRPALKRQDIFKLMEILGFVEIAQEPPKSAASKRVAPRRRSGRN